MDVDELLHHLVIVDLETTGLDPAADLVIELGAVFVEEGRVVRRVSKLFSAGRPLPLTIRRLTGLTDEALAGQPPFRAEGPELARSLAGWTMVAHNATFECSFLADVLAAAGSPVLDSCELLHLLFPELESHSLESMVRWAGVSDRAAHRALRDCEDTLAVLRHALGRCVAEARGDDVADLLDALEAPARPRDRPFGPAEPRDPLVDLLARLLEVCVRTPPSERPAPPSPSAKVTAAAPPDGFARGNPQAEVDALLGPGGALESASPDFESRPEQLELAKAVAGALAAERTLAIEAAPGTGKTLAALTGAAVAARCAGRKLGFAYPARGTGQARAEAELSRLRAAPGSPPSAAVLKSRGAYLCRRRVLEATAAGHGRPTRAERAARAYLRAFLRRSPDGDLDRVSVWFCGHAPPLRALVEAVRSEAAGSLGGRCPEVESCFFHSAVARAEAADVVVAAHPLALAWPSEYPRVAGWVLDEAHELEDAATSAYGVQLSGSLLGQFVGRLRGDGVRTGLLAALGPAAATLGGAAPAAELLADLRSSLSRVDGEAAELAEAVRAFSGPTPVAAGWAERRLVPEARTGRAWLKVRDGLLGVRREVEDLSQRLSSPLAVTAPGLAKEDPGLDGELRAVRARAEEISVAVGELTDAPEPGRCYQAAARAGSGDWTLASLPTDVGPVFVERFSAQARSLVLVSETLGPRPGQPWVLERLGLASPEEPVPLVRWGSRFDLSGRALVVLVLDAPRATSEAFVAWTAARLGGLAQFLSGRVLGLFASARRLEAVEAAALALVEPFGVEVVRRRARGARAPVARQGSSPAVLLLDIAAARREPGGPEADLGCVFIDKLAFEPRSRPLVEARIESLGGGRRGFLGYSLPRALVQLRREVGQLVLSPNGGGVAVIADPGNPSYRDELLAALGDYRVVSLPWTEARLAIRAHFAALGLGPRAAEGVAAPAP